MSDQTTNGFPAPDGSGQATPSSTEGSSTARSSGMSGKAKAGLGVAGLCAAAVVGGGAYAYSELAGGGLQPADVLPASSDTAIRIDLDPSANQKVEVIRLLNKLPSLGKELGIEDADKSDLRERAFDAFISGRCSDVDYQKDVEPWIGDRVGMAGEFDARQGVVALQVTDEGKAQDGLKKLSGCGGDFAFSFYEGYAIMSIDQGSVDDAIDATRKESLADSERYSKRMDELGEQGLVSAWIDFKAAAKFAEEAAPGAAPGTFDQAAELSDMSIALRAGGSALELTTVSDEVEGVKDAKGGPTLGNLPSDTVFAAASSGIDAELVGEAWGAMLSGLTQSMIGDTTGGPDPEQVIKDFEGDSGISLPEDLQTLLGGGLSLSVGDLNLDRLETASGPDDLAGLDIALRAYNDDSAEVLNKLFTWLAKYQVKLAVEEADSGAALATNPDAAKAAVEGGDLSNKNVDLVVPNADQVQQAYYLDVAAITKALGDSRAADQIPDEFEAVEAIGLWFGNIDGAGKSSLRIGFKESN